METTRIRRWSPVWVTAYGVLSALMVVAGVLALVEDRGDWQGWLWFLVYAVVGALIMWSCWREAVEVDPGGVRLVRFARSDHFPWQDIDEVAKSRGEVNWPTWRVVTTDGRVHDTHLPRTDPVLGEVVARHRPASPPAGHD